MRKIAIFNFKKRATTERICVVLKAFNGADKQKLYSNARKRGYLDTGFHIIMYHSGLMDYDREMDAIADASLPNNSTSIYVLAEYRDKKQLSDAQKVALTNLGYDLDLPIEIIEA